MHWPSSPLLGLPQLFGTEKDFSGAIEPELFRFFLMQHNNGSPSELLELSSGHIHDMIIYYHPAVGRTTLHHRHVQLCPYVFQRKPPMQFRSSNSTIAIQVMPIIPHLSSNRFHPMPDIGCNVLYVIQGICIHTSIIVPSNTTVNK
jgi:hypothetical protein